MCDVLRTAAGLCQWPSALWPHLHRGGARLQLLGGCRCWLRNRTYVWVLTRPPTQCPWGSLVSFRGLTPPVCNGKGSTGTSRTGRDLSETPAPKCLSICSVSYVCASRSKDVFEALTKIHKDKIKRNQAKRSRS